MSVRLSAAAVPLVVAAALIVAAVVWAGGQGEPPTGGASPTPETTPAVVAPSTSPTPAPSPTPDPSPTRELAGLFQFRGNPTHTFYGRGPLPSDPDIAWRFPDGAMCSTTTQGDGSTKRWCGTGWTGQPLVWEHDGITEVIFNSYDGNVYFLDGDTGEQTRQPFRTGEMVKGTWTLDPDGYPLLYGGSRDNFYRIVALDREVPAELWRMGPHPNGQWNNDWDGNGSIVDDMLYVGGEDSFFYAVRLHRATGEDGLVTVDPEVLVATPTFNDEYHALTGDRQTSVESSPVVTDDAVYVANSAGRVVGWSRDALVRGEAEVVFDWWAGDDVDASLVHSDGHLYVAVEWDRKLPRGREVGQLIGLDLSRPDDPWVWGVDLHSDGVGDGGLWSTPALHGDHLYVTTHRGSLIVVNRHSGKVVHEEPIGFHEWSSPAVVSSPERGVELLVALCQGGGLRGYSLSDPTTPVQTWELQLPTGACVESTPAVWGGRIWVGSRDGFFYGIR